MLFIVNPALLQFCSVTISHADRLEDSEKLFLRERFCQMPKQELGQLLSTVLCFDQTFRGRRGYERMATLEARLFVPLLGSGAAVV